uniref:Uncharacterized protein n=1 Tax=Vespula pensylvanica TaxID=30213 RepID=A0A834P0C6_VESPE|nr:hypothetical protein H0235_008592 [Vespula pensylvanica]
MEEKEEEKKKKKKEEEEKKVEKKDRRTTTSFFDERNREQKERHGSVNTILPDGPANSLELRILAWPGLSPGHGFSLGTERVFVLFGDSYLRVERIRREQRLTRTTPRPTKNQIELLRKFVLRICGGFYEKGRGQKQAAIAATVATTATSSRHYYYYQTRSQYMCQAFRLIRLASGNIAFRLAVPSEIADDKY